MLILLADDEKYVRLGLQSMIEELYPEQHQFIQARNGREIITIMQENKPDVAFLDIKMPFMDGLEALRICKEISPDTLWIILSGYENFEYARQALSMSAIEYLVKPIDIDTISSLFGRICDSRSGRREERNKSFVHDITRTFNMAAQLPEEDVEFLPARPSDYILYQFYMDFPDPETLKAVNQKLITSLESFCRENAIIVDYCIFFNQDGCLCLVCDTPDASRLTHYIYMQSSTSVPYSFSVFFGNDKQMKNIYAISRRIHQFAPIRLLHNCQNPVYYKNIDALPCLEEMLKFSEKILEMYNHLLADNWIIYQQEHKELEQNKEYRSLYAKIDTRILEGYIQRFFQTALPCRSYEQLLAALDLSTADKTNLSSVFADSSLEKVKQYVRQNYASDLSIHSVSALFHVSPTYFSRVFHEKTGQKYIDFVTEVRIAAAIKLLSDNPDANIRQVAEMVGFSSARYFSKLFQKYTGMLPSEYGSQATTAGTAPPSQTPH